MFVEGEDKAGSVVFYNSHGTSGVLADVRKMAARQLVSDGDNAATLTPCRSLRAGQGSRLKVNITQGAAV